MDLLKGEETDSEQKGTSRCGMVGESVESEVRTGVEIEQGSSELRPWFIGQEIVESRGISEKLGWLVGKVVLGRLVSKREKSTESVLWNGNTCSWKITSLEIITWWLVKSRSL